MQGQLWNAVDLVTVSSTDVHSSSVSAVPAGICTVFSFPDKCDSAGSAHVRCALLVSLLSQFHTVCPTKDAGLICKDSGHQSLMPDLRCVRQHACDISLKLSSGFSLLGKRVSSA